MEVMIAHARDPVVPPSQLRPEIPADLEAGRASLPRQESRRSLSRTPRAWPRPSTPAPTPPNWSPEHAARLVADHPDAARREPLARAATVPDAIRRSESRVASPTARRSQSAEVPRFM